MCSLRQASNAIAAHFGERAIRVIQAHCERVCVDATKQQQTVGTNARISIAPIASNIWPIDFRNLSVTELARLTPIKH
jgi:hypothetical protein